MPRKKVCMQDIADMVGISKNAVSLALNGKPGVSAALRKSVIKAAKDLNYGIPVQNAEEGKKVYMMVLVPEYIIDDRYFYHDIYWAIEKQCHELGHTAILTRLTRSAESALELPDSYYSTEFEGIIVVGVVSVEYVRKLVSLEKHIVCVDNAYEGVQVDEIVTANIEGAYEITRYLIEQGHTRIGYVGSIMETSSNFERWSGFQKAMLAHGLKLDPSISITEHSSLNVLLQDPEEIEQHLARVKKYPTAWFCANDRVAIALITALEKQGMKVPTDISVAGFDDIAVAGVYSPHLTTARVQREMMGSLAVEMILDRWQAPRKVSLFTQLVVRDSVRKNDSTFP